MFLMLKVFDTTIMLQQGGISGDLCIPNMLRNTINGFIQGNVPLTTSNVIRYNSLITAVAVTRIEQHTVVFLGTHDGKLKKVRATICYLIIIFFILFFSFFFF